MSPEIGVEFECSEEEAQGRVEEAGHGEVTEDGNYYREQVVTVPQYQAIRNGAEMDDEAEIQRVSL